MIPFLKRCHRLERLSTDVPDDEETLTELTWSLYENCPRLNQFSAVFNSTVDSRLANLFLTSQQGWKNLELNYALNLGRDAIMAIMGTGEQVRPRRFHDSTSTASSLTSQLAASLLDEKNELVASKVRNALAVAGTSMIVICPRLRFLERIEIEGCSAFTSMDLQTILCSCPSLRGLLALSSSSVPGTKDPILMVADMKKPVLRVESGTEADVPNANAGDPRSENEEQGQSNWACLGLEILCLRIQCEARPDLRVKRKEQDDFNEAEEHIFDPTDVRNRLDLEALKESRKDQKVVYKQLGQLKRLRILRLGYNGRSNWVPNVHESRDIDLLDLAPSLSDSNGNQGRPVSYLPGPVPSDHWLNLATNSRQHRLLYYVARAGRHYNVGARHQQLSLEWNLDSGLGLFLRGARNIESIDLHQMATRFGMSEVKAMVEAWPKLRHMDFLTGHHDDDSEDEDDDEDDDEDATSIEYDLGSAVDMSSEFGSPTSHSAMDIVPGTATTVAPTATAPWAHLFWMREKHPEISIHSSIEDEDGNEDFNNWSQWD